MSALKSIYLTQSYTETEAEIIFIPVHSTEIDMPWHGALGAETGVCI